ncbi:hypothetical protein C7974DRAFT_420445 [Boeremia exigua]|uniref:uncharacterized protein n=1 Tax=Boeremia exigua TaxID=749465 RepID=UPI001E8D0B51|nr:uncharacterized protein C7974DRAFT_420445 [Boeremia exigua]KAH6642111.1 hypothetical protein C7974DRAFT_420445 [Boeremia exigua]
MSTHAAPIPPILPRPTSTPVYVPAPDPPGLQGPPGPQGPEGPPGLSHETLEQRIYDLLAPFCATNLTPAAEAKALILCENIAFLIRHQQASYGKRIEPSDVSMATKNWAAMTTGKGLVGVCVFANGHGFSHAVVRAAVGRGEDVVEKLGEQVEVAMVQFFPGIF